MASLAAKSQSRLGDQAWAKVPKVVSSLLISDALDNSKMR
jgi:hypothetical protein